SFDDHSDFLKKQRYSSLFELEITDYKGWAQGLKSCGYATSPEYAQLLIRIIEENKLEQYDEQGLLLAKNDDLPKRSANKPKARVSSESSKSNRKNKPASGEERTEITLTGNHEVLVSDNRIKYIIAREGDTRESIAREIDLNVFILNRFNDFDRAMELKPGDIVYLQPKRNQTRNAEYVATEGDT
ncbi:MAG: glucosaminidase domain-containing protein, partial [Flavobacteriales bacterium]